MNVHHHVRNSIRFDHSNISSSSQTSKDRSPSPDWKKSNFMVQYTVLENGIRSFLKVNGPDRKIYGPEKVTKQIRSFWAENKRSLESRITFKFWPILGMKYTANLRNQV